MQQTTRQGQLDSLDTFIELWADTSSMKSLQEQANALSDQGVTLQYQVLHHADVKPGTAAYEDLVRKIGIVEKFMGFTYAGGCDGGVSFTPMDTTPGVSHYVASGDPQIEDINRAYDLFKTDIYESLLLQSRLKPYMDKLDLVLEADGTMKLDATRIQGAFDAAIVANPQDGFTDLVEFTSAFGDKRLTQMGWNVDAFIGDESTKLSALPVLNEELSAWTPQFAQAGETTLMAASAGSQMYDQRSSLMIGLKDEDTWLYGSTDVLGLECKDLFKNNDLFLNFEVRGAELSLINQ